jgi:hypothetical protein
MGFVIAMKLEDDNDLHVQVADLKAEWGGARQQSSPPPAACG